MFFIFVFMSMFFFSLSSCVCFFIFVFMSMFFVYMFFCVHYWRPPPWGVCAQRGDRVLTDGQPETDRRRLGGDSIYLLGTLYWHPPLLLLPHLYPGRVQSAPKKIGLGCAQGASSSRHNYNGNAKLGPYTFKKEKPFTFPTVKLLSFCQVASWTQFYNWPYCKFVSVMLLQRKDISESKKGDIAGISGGDENGSKLGGKKYENWWKVVKRGHLGGSCHRGQPPLKLSHIGLTHPIPCPSQESVFWQRLYCSLRWISLF